MTFLDDIHKMINFISLPRNKFMTEYNYISSVEYDITNDIFFSDLQANTKRLKCQVDQVSQGDIKQLYKTILDKFVQKYVKKS